MTISSIIKHCEKSLNFNNTLAAPHLFSKTLIDDNSIGRYTESLLGIKENNKQEPDFPEVGVEIKTYRIGSNCPTTLLCKEPNIKIHPDIKGKRKGVITYLTEIAGISTIDNPDRLNFKFDITGNNSVKFGNNIFSLEDYENNISICMNYEPIAAWDHTMLTNTFQKKFGKYLLNIGCRVNESDKTITYENMDLYNGICNDRYKMALMNDITISFRAHKDRRMRNHGTGQRIKDIGKLFEQNVKVY